MAAPGRHVGRYFQTNSRFLVNNLEQLWAQRSFGWTPALRQQTAEDNKETPETIVIPKKKAWSKEAVLEALAATVGRDPTAYGYQFQDDPYLYPRTNNEFRMFSLSMESGRSAAQYFINSNPKFFTKDFAEPHIPCLMPETISLHLEEVSEEALKERISLRKVRAAVDMYDQIMQTGTAVSMDTTQDLLDLICFYCDCDPVANAPEVEDLEPGEGMKPKKGMVYRATDLIKTTWKENNNAERIFNLLPERDSRSYSALIRGMVKHGAFEKAFSFYTDMLNNKLTGDVHIFNALISAAPDMRERYVEKWELINELLTHMNQQEVEPNLLTFNSTLQALTRCGSFGKTKCIHTLNEMKAMGITPSLASYSHILSVHYKTVTSAQGNTDILQEVMLEVAGTSFTCQDPSDVLFFSNAMKVCIDHKDLQLGYRVHSLVEFGDNWRLLGNPYLRSIYYGRFFNLLCMMEQVDTTLKWYTKLIPSIFYPNIQCMKDLFQALDTDGRLDMLPTIWKDMCSMGHDNKNVLVEELLALMARDKHTPEVQKTFAECALNVMSVYSADKGKRRLLWSSSAYSCITLLLLRANQIHKAWDTLMLFKKENGVPRDGLFEEFLTVCHTNGLTQKAVDLVELSAVFCLPLTPKLAKRTLAKFHLTETQRAVLSKLDSALDPSD